MNYRFASGEFLIVISFSILSYRTVAAAKGEETIINSLLANGANIDHRDNTGSKKIQNCDSGRATRMYFDTIINLIYKFQVQLHYKKPPHWVLIKNNECIIATAFS